ncbi:MAG: aconitate hydratase, partial [Pseudomonadota bacterium]
SPPLVVAYALAGSMDVNLMTDPLGNDREGNPVFLRDIWPSQQEIHDLIQANVDSSMFKSSYAGVFDGDANWNSLDVASGEIYAWDPTSTYVKHPPYFEGMTLDTEPVGNVEGARVLALLGDSVTTDHISPAGSIAADSPAAEYLREQGVKPGDFNSYGSRRGNHEVMMRGTFANIRLRNLLAPGTEGGWTRHQPSDEQMTIYDASRRYAEDRTPLIVLAGSEYGTGSSRDWAAKGTLLLGVKAVIAKSFERIHRSNLIGMGVLPLQFKADEDAASLGLTGKETFTITGQSDPDARSVSVTAVDDDGRETRFEATVRIDTPKERDYFEHGGILHYVLRQLVRAKADAAA